MTLLDQALQHHQAGRLGDAERLYREILAADARNADALHLLGVLAYQAGKADIAVGMMSQAVAIDGTKPAVFYNLGIALQNLRRSGAGTGQLSAIHHNRGGNALDGCQQVVRGGDRLILQFTKYTPGS